MNKIQFEKAREEKVLKAYEEVDEFTKQDLLSAITWAKDTLRDLEGSGHIIEVIGHSKVLVVCCFSKVSWSADHCGRPMETGSEAIVMAVCEYLNGV